MKEGGRVYPNDIWITVQRTVHARRIDYLACEVDDDTLAPLYRKGTRCKNEIIVQKEEEVDKERSKGGKAKNPEYSLGHIRFTEKGFHQKHSDKTIISEIQAAHTTI